MSPLRFAQHLSLSSQLHNLLHRNIYARSAAEKLFQSRGKSMTIVTRIASALAAAFMSGAVLSLAIY
jgi:hypothetical protein